MALIDVSRDKIDVVLHAFQLYLVKALCHAFIVLLLKFNRIHFDLPACFHINEFHRAAVEVKVQFFGFFIDMEQDHLVLVVFEVLQGRK